MAFLYMFKAGGTAVGNNGRYDMAGPNVPSGAFADAASNDWGSKGLGSANDYYYDSIVEVLATPTTPFALGDRGYGSHLHVKTRSSSWTYTGSLTTGKFPFWSVDDANCDQYLKGALEDSSTDTSDLTFQEGLAFTGISFSRGDDIILGSDSRLSISDASIKSTGTSSVYNFNSAGSGVELTNVTLEDETATGINYMIHVSSGCSLKCRNVNARAPNSSGFSDLLVGSSGGGATVEWIGGDVTDVTDFLLGITGNDPQNEDTNNYFYKNILISATVQLIEETLSKPSQHVKMVNSTTAAASATMEYQREEHGYGGFVIDQDTAGIIRDESLKYPNGEKVSNSVTTNAFAAMHDPFTFQVNAGFAALDKTTKKIRIYFVSTSTLLDTMLWFRVGFPTVADPSVYDFVDTRPADLLSTGTEFLTDATSTWLDGGAALAGHNIYYKDVDTSAIGGANCVPLIEAYLGDASITVIFDTSVGVVA